MIHDRARWVARALIDLAHARPDDLLEVLDRFVERCVEIVGPGEVRVVFAADGHLPDADGFHAVPLHHADAVIGAVHVRRADGAALPPADVELLQSLADMAASTIERNHALRDAEVLAEQLRYGLRSRVALEQAKGVVAEHLHVEVGDAFELLRSFARSRNEQLADVAARVVGGALTVEEILDADRRPRPR